MNDETKPIPDVMTIDPKSLPSAVLQRLVAEVQWEIGHGMVTTTERTMGYERVHNRHHRSLDNPGNPYNRVHNRHNRGVDPTSPRRGRS
jgi:hypothetical protein